MTFFFVLENFSAERGLSQLEANQMCTIWSVSLRHAASDTVRPALLIGGRRVSTVDIAFVAPDTSSSVVYVLGNRCVEGWGK